MSGLRNATEADRCDVEAMIDRLDDGRYLYIVHNGVKYASFICNELGGEDAHRQLPWVAGSLNETMWDVAKALNAAELAGPLDVTYPE